MGALYVSVYRARLWHQVARPYGRGEGKHGGHALGAISGELCLVGLLGCEHIRLVWRYASAGKNAFVQWRMIVGAYKGAQRPLDPIVPLFF